MSKSSKIDPEMFAEFERERSALLSRIENYSNEVVSRGVASEVVSTLRQHCLPDYEYRLKRVRDYRTSRACLKVLDRWLEGLGELVARAERLKIMDDPSASGSEVAALARVFRDPSQRSGDRFALLRSMPYSDYLLTPEWRWLRERVLRQAQYRCQICSEGEGVLHVHHRSYSRRGAESVRDVVVLCSACHDLFHKHRKLAVH